MAGRVQQLLSVVLAVDVQQLTPQLPQLGHGHQPPVHPADIPAVPLDLPLEEQLLPRRDPVFLQPAQPGHAGEHRVDQGRLRPGADQLPAGPLPQHRTDGVNDDGLARSGLTGQSVEARIELDIGPLDDRDILNVKQRKHLCPS